MYEYGGRKKKEEGKRLMITAITLKKSLTSVQVAQAGQSFDNM